MWGLLIGFGVGDFCSVGFGCCVLVFVFLHRGQRKDTENIFKSFQINSLFLQHLPWYIAAAASIVSLCSRGFLFQEQLLSPIPKNTF